MLNVTPAPPPAGAANGQKRRKSGNPPHAERIQAGVASRRTGERAGTTPECSLTLSVLPVNEQPATTASKAQAGTIFTMRPTPVPRLAGVQTSASNLAPSTTESRRGGTRG